MESIAIIAQLRYQSSITGCIDARDDNQPRK
jgi:hypothetical protein